MGRNLRVLCWLLALVFLIFDLYQWGGLAITPTVGPDLREQASVRSPLAASYLFLGRHAVDAARMESSARDFANRHFASQIQGEHGSPRLIVERFLAAQSAVSQLAYYGAPILLVLSLLLHARRPKQIRSFGGRG